MYELFHTHRSRFHRKLSVVLVCVDKDKRKETYTYGKEVFTTTRDLHGCLDKETYMEVRTRSREVYEERWGAGVEYHFQEI